MHYREFASYAPVKTKRVCVGVCALRLLLYIVSPALEGVLDFHYGIMAWLFALADRHYIVPPIKLRWAVTLGRMISRLVGHSSINHQE